MEQQFYKEEKQLLKYFINNYTFDKEKNYNDINFSQYLFEYSVGSPTEFIIRPECNQQCKYCYITQHGKELYPIEERKDNKVLNNNLRLLLNYYLKNKILIPHIEIFAGDLFYDDLIYEIFSIIYDYYSTIYQTEAYYFNKIITERKNFFKIIIPCNFSFVNNSKHLPELKSWQKKFSNFAIKLDFSASVDGKFATEVRENKNNNEIDNYYDKVLEAAFELNAGLHPMVSAESIENANKNYDWWLEQIDQKINQKITNSNFHYDFQPMLLEVRNGNCWTSDKINKYVDFLNHMFEKRLELCDNSIEKLTYHLFIGDGKNNTLRKLFNYDPLMIPDVSNKEESTCGLTKVLHINLSDLSFVPCHRLTYYQFKGGYFKIQDNEIIDIEPINVSGFLSIISHHFHYKPKCQNCTIREVCLKGCLGAQYEHFGELFVPIPSVCDLELAKIKTVLTCYNEAGVLKELKKSQYPSDILPRLIKICNKLNIEVQL